MKWLGIFLTLTNGAAIGHAADDVALFDGKKIEVVVEGRKIFSKRCESVQSCFQFPQELDVVPFQSPLFSLCLQSSGKPGFGKLKRSQKKIEFCLNEKGEGVELNMLMDAFNSSFRKVDDPLESVDEGRAAKASPKESAEAKAQVKVKVRSALDKMRKKETSAPNDFLKTGSEKNKRN